ncbi:MAG: crossover junction endodeoxyribonuclease RuvC [Parcubacteria group bacterium]
MKKNITQPNNDSMKVLGIDPGTATTGWAIVTEKNCEFVPLAYGHISTEKEKSDDERILEISQDLKKIIDKYAPQEAAIEELFFFKNKKTVIQVAQARGAILLTLREKGVKVCGYTPLQVKQALTGYGRADKNQIQEMTKNIMKLATLPKPDDTADALAIALCHLNSRKMNIFHY